MPHPDTSPSRWPSDAVLWEGIIDEDLAMSVDHKVHVFIFRDLETLQAAAGDPNAGAHSISFREADDLNVRAAVLLAAPIQLSQLAHEAAHIGLYWSKATARPKQRAWSWIEAHPESLAELIGNLTAFLWYSLPAQYLDS
jgi:hypothetical protein